MTAPSVAEVLGSLAETVPPGRAAGWDPVGLQIGDGAAQAATVAVCHEVTPEVVAAAEAAAVDLLITYHPLLFRPVTSLIAGPGASGRAYRLAAAGVSVAVVHTAFDVAEGGTADSLAAALGLSGSSGFGPAWGAESVKFVVFVPATHVEAIHDVMTAAGGGRIGAYTGCSFRTPGVGAFDAGAGTNPTAGRRGQGNREPEVRLEMVAPRVRRDAVAAALAAAHPYEEPAYDVFEHRGNAGFVGRVGSLDSPLPLTELADRVAEVLGGVVRVADAGRAVARVAVVPGSGGDFIGEAASLADVLVTGDVSHHRAREALDRGLAVIDPGHAPTERPGMRSLYAAVARIAQDAIDMTDIETSPWKER